MFLLSRSAYPQPCRLRSARNGLSYGQLEHVDAHLPSRQTVAAARISDYRVRQTTSLGRTRINESDDGRDDDEHGPEQDHRSVTRRATVPHIRTDRRKITSGAVARRSRGVGRLRIFDRFAAVAAHREAALTNELSRPQSAGALIRHDF